MSQDEERESESDHEVTISVGELAPHRQVLAAMLSVLLPNDQDATVVAAMMDLDACKSYASSIIRTIIKSGVLLTEENMELKHVRDQLFERIDGLQRDLEQSRIDREECVANKTEEISRQRQFIEDLQNQIRAMVQSHNETKDRYNSLSAQVVPLMHHPEMASIILGDKFEPFLNALKINNKIEAIKILRQATNVGLVEAKEEVEALMNEGIYNTYKLPGAKRTLKQHPVYTMKAWRDYRKQAVAAGEKPKPYKIWVMSMTNQQF